MHIRADDLNIDYEPSLLYRILKNTIFKEALNTTEIVLKQNDYLQIQKFREVIFVEMLPIFIYPRSN